MVKYHGKSVCHYVLSLMQIVSIKLILTLQVDMIYRDSTIGNLIHISVVKLLILKENESFAPKKSQFSVSASDMLKSFCKWQTHLNSYEGSVPQYYDVALLLTRYGVTNRLQDCNKLDVIVNWTFIIF